MMLLVSATVVISIVIGDAVVGFVVAVLIFADRALESTDSQ